MINSTLKPAGEPVPRHDDEDSRMALIYSTLHDAEQSLHLLSTARDAAQEQGVPAPWAPDHYLGWFLYEVHQLLARSGKGEELAVRYQRASTILRYCERLASLGIAPAPLAGRVDGAPTRSQSEPGGLTRREQEVMLLLREGMRSQEIAVALRLRTSTVHKHLQDIFAKLGARNRVEALKRWGQQAEAKETTR